MKTHPSATLPKAPLPSQVTEWDVDRGGVVVGEGRRLDGTSTGGVRPLNVLSAMPIER